jgi:hypothetical protein
MNRYYCPNRALTVVESGLEIAYMVRLAVLLTCWFTLSQPASADTSRFGTRQDFVDRHHCAVTARLQTLYDKVTTKPQDRFLILALSYSEQSFVQCLFEDDNSEVLCEASSGFYSAKPGEPRTFSLTPDAIAEVRDLGFDTDDSKGNYVIIKKIKSFRDLAPLTDFMLTALHRVYGANLTSQLDVSAPSAELSHEERLKCTPLS